jgi:hypothetical protein
VGTDQGGCLYGLPGGYPGPVGGGAWTVEQPATTVYGDQLYAFYIALTTGNRWICYGTYDSATGAWSRLQSVGSPTPDGQLSTTTGGIAATVYDNRLYLFAVGAQGAIYDDVYDRNSSPASWSGWQWIGNNTCVGIAAKTFDDQLYLFEVDPQLHIEENVYTDGAAWSGWTVIDSIAYTAPAVTVYYNQLRLFAVGSDGALYDNISTDGTSWSGWQRIDSYTNYPPTVTVYNDQLRLFAVGTDGLVYENVSSGSGWSGWDSAPNQREYPDTAPAVTTYNGQIALLCGLGTGQDLLWMTMGA